MKITKEVEIDGEDHDIEINIELDDVLEFISQANGREVQDIHDEAISEGADPDDCECDEWDLSEIETYNQCAKYQDYPLVENLADEMKMTFINEIWNKYTLEQLEERLK